MGNADPLYELFERHLIACLALDESGESLVQRVVEGYLEELVREAFIPMQFSEMVEQDLREEVKTMLLKKTYGYYNLSAYLKAQTDGEAPTPTKRAS